MIIGIGTDIVDIDRIRKAMEKLRFMEEYFGASERELLLKKSNPAPSTANNFAAKEAFGKALGTGLRNLVLKDIQVQQDELGRPFLHLCGSAKKCLQESGATVAHISLSHDGNYGIAYVVLEAGASEEKIC